MRGRVRGRVRGREGEREGGREGGRKEGRQRDGHVGACERTHTNTPPTTMANLRAFRNVFIANNTCDAAIFQV